MDSLPAVSDFTARIYIFVVRIVQTGKAGYKKHATHLHDSQIASVIALAGFPPHHHAKSFLKIYFCNTDAIDCLKTRIEDPLAALFFRYVLN